LLNETTAAFDGARTNDLHITSQTYRRYRVCVNRQSRKARGEFINLSQ